MSKVVDILVFIMLSPLIVLGAIIALVHIGIRGGYNLTADWLENL